ncbi:MAG: AAA family ATPase [Novosphingobium sp.]
MMGEVAAELLGKPNEHLSKINDGVLKFGTNGSMEVNTREGWFADYEANVRGGVLDLIAHKAGAQDHASAFRWLEDHGIKEPSDNTDKPIPKFYDYADESGAVLFRVERKGKGDSKTFLQHGPDGNGGFICNKGCMQGVRRVLYRLPELIAADPAEIVFVCEGEKDADNLAAHGLIATTNPGGAGKFLRDFAPVLEGRRVVVLEDNDEAGRNHAADVEAKLKSIAAMVTTLKLPGASKSDVSDWLENSGSGSAFELRRKAGEALDKATAPDDLVSLDLAALATVAPKAKLFSIERLAPLAEVTLFTGPGSAGKSLLGQQLATAAAADLQCLGLDVMPGPAIYLTCEDDAEQLHFRQAHICDSMGVPMASLSGKLHLMSLRGALDNALTVEADKGKLMPSESYQRLVRKILATGSKLVFLDNVAHLFTGNENDRGEVTRFVNLLNKAAGETGAAIVLLGHPNKQGDQWSGSTAWPNAVRSRIYLEHDEETDLRTLSLPKSNYGQKGEVVSFRWHEWAFVLDKDLPADTRAEIAQVVKANGENAAFLRCLAAATESNRAVSHNPGSNYAPKVFAAMPESKSYTAKALAGAMERLLHLGTIALDQPLWRGPNRVMKQGIKLAKICTDPPARTPCTDPHETPGNAARFNPPIYKYISGAGPDGPPPPIEDYDLDWGTDGEGEQ